MITNNQRSHLWCLVPYPGLCLKQNHVKDNVKATMSCSTVHNVFLSTLSRNRKS